MVTHYIAWMLVTCVSTDSKIHLQAHHIDLGLCNIDEELQI